MKRAGVEGLWAAGERILLLIGPDAMAASQVRAARRLSDMIMDAPWTVAHVERPSRVTAGDPQRGVRLNEALKLAEQLGGAAMVVLNDDDLVTGVLGFARRNNVTQIVLRRLRHGGWRRVLRRSLTLALLKASTGAALHISTEGPTAPEPPVIRPRASRSIDWRGSLGAAGTVGLAWLVSMLIDQRVENANLAMNFMLSVLLSGLAFGFWPAVLAAATGGAAVVLLPSADSEIAPVASAPETAVLSTADMAAARWAWEKGGPAGASTGTLPNAAWTFRPLQGVKARSGVAGLDPKALAAEEDERFAAALLDQGAAALERAELAAQAADADAEALRRADRLRSALLNSVSHDLRTPLSTVRGAATTLIDYGKVLQPKVRADLLLSIREEAERLNRYVGDRFV